MDWWGLKAVASELLLEKDALHIYCALAIQLLAAVVTRRPLGHPTPWLAVLGFAFANEALDLLLGEEAQIKPWQIRGAAHDLVNTMALPTILLLLSRHRPGLFTRDRPRAEQTDAAPGPDMEASCPPIA